MMEFAAHDQDQNTATEAGRKRTFETAIAELAITVCLILSIVVILAVASASGAIAATRSDLIMMEETSSSYTTMIILAVIAVVMGALTILALRDVAPAHSKRGQRRTTSSASTQVSRR